MVSPRHNFKKTEIVVCGGGILGCYLSVLLAKQGAKVMMIDSGTLPAHSFRSGLNVWWPSLNDPPTRAVVAHGEELAKTLQEYCSEGVEIFKNQIFSEIAHVGTVERRESTELESFLTSVPVFRLGHEEHELVELKKAMSQNLGLFEIKGKNGVYSEKDGLMMHETKFFQSCINRYLRKYHVNVTRGTVARIDENKDHCDVHTNDGRTFRSEIVVLATNHHIGKLMPEYQNILVPMTDILAQYEGSFKEVPAKALRHGSFRAASGHLAARWTMENNSLFVSVTGPRFLLPYAGIGMEPSNLSVNLDTLAPKLGAVHHKQIFNFIAQQLGLENSEQLIKETQLRRHSIQLIGDCHPCDELPIVGEIGKQGRILTSAGWLAVGLSAQAKAASLLAEMIVKEKPNVLHPLLHPRRFKAS